MFVCAQVFVSICMCACALGLHSFDRYVLIACLVPGCVLCAMGSKCYELDINIQYLMHSINSISGRVFPPFFMNVGNLNNSKILTTSSELPCWLRQ